MYMYKQDLAMVDTPENQAQNKMQSLPSSGRVDTAIWVHYIDVNKTNGEKV